MIFRAVRFEQGTRQRDRMMTDCNRIAPNAAERRKLGNPRR